MDFAASDKVVQAIPSAGSSKSDLDFYTELDAYWLMSERLESILFQLDLQGNDRVPQIWITKVSYSNFNPVAKVWSKEQYFAWLDHYQE